VHAKGEWVILTAADVRKEIDLTPPRASVPESAGLPEPVCPQGVVSSEGAGFEEPAGPGESPLDEGLTQLRQMQITSRFTTARYSRSAASGIPEQMLMARLGHRDSDMVRHYYHLSQDEARKQMAKIPFLSAPDDVGEQRQRPPKKKLERDEGG
jgi:hypothetical protein